LNLDEIKYMDVSAEELERWRLIPGDILLCEGNSSELVGRAAEFRGEIENCVHQNHVIRVRPDRSAVLSTFLLSYMNSGIGRAYFRSKAKRTTNLATINSSEVRAMPVVLPPLEEQSKLVRGVEAVRQAVLSVRSRQEERKRAVVAVRRALLDRAFEGTGGWEPGR